MHFTVNFRFLLFFFSDYNTVLTSVFCPGWTRQILNDEQVGRQNNCEVNNYDSFINVEVVVSSQWLFRLLSPRAANGTAATTATGATTCTATATRHRYCYCMLLLLQLPVLPLLRVLLLLLYRQWNSATWLLFASFYLWSLFTGKLKHFSIECGINYAIALVSFGLGQLFNQSGYRTKTNCDWVTLIFSRLVPATFLLFEFWLANKNKSCFVVGLRAYFVQNVICCSIEDNSCRSLFYILIYL